MQLTGRMAHPVSSNACCCPRPISSRYILHIKSYATKWVHDTSRQLQCMLLPQACIIQVPNAHLQSCNHTCGCLILAAAKHRCCLKPASSRYLMHIINHAINWVHDSSWQLQRTAAAPGLHHPGTHCTLESCNVLGARFSHVLSQLQHNCFGNLWLTLSPMQIASCTVSARLSGYIGKLRL